MSTSVGVYSTNGGRLQRKLDSRWFLCVFGVASCRHWTKTTSRWKEDQQQSTSITASKEYLMSRVGAIGGNVGRFMPEERRKPISGLGAKFAQAREEEAEANSSATRIRITPKQKAMFGAAFGEHSCSAGTLAYAFWLPLDAMLSCALINQFPRLWQ